MTSNPERALSDTPAAAAMRVLLVHNRYRSSMPSGENRVVDLESAALARAGVVVERFERSSDDLEDAGAVAKVRTAAQVVWSESSRRALKDALRSFRPDVVHVHNVVPLISPSVLAACERAGIPVVVTLHNYRLLCAPGDLFRDGQVCTDCLGGHHARGLRHGCYRGSTAATAPLTASLWLHDRRWRRAVAAFLCLSNAQRDLFRSAGFPPEKLLVKANFAEDPWPGGAAPVVTPEHVLFLGRVSYAKGVKVLMDAWDQISGPRPPLVIAGSGPQDEEVGAWARRRTDVRVVGHRRPDECRDLIERAHAVVIPSVWLETFGLVAIEAMALGVPPIASAHASFSDIVTDGVNGRLFRPGDPADLARVLASVISQPDVRAALGTNARTTYEQRYRPEVVVSHLMQIYESVRIRAGGS